MFIFYEILLIIKPDLVSPERQIQNTRNIPGIAFEYFGKTPLITTTSPCLVRVFPVFTWWLFGVADTKDIPRKDQARSMYIPG
jgi:hypothetical protein